MQYVTSTFVIALVSVLIVTAARAEEPQPLFVREADATFSSQVLKDQNPWSEFDLDAYLKDRRMVIPEENCSRQNLWEEFERFHGEIIIDDFQVNEEIVPGFGSKGSPDVATDGSGRFVVVWEDRRNGAFDVYAQLYDSTGNAVGVNFRVNDDPLGCNVSQGSPSVAMSSEGAFVVVWSEGQNGSDIYARRYDPEGNPVGSSFRVNDDEGNAQQGDPSVDMAADGCFVVAWRDERSDTKGDIYAQCFDSEGISQSPNFKVNGDAEGSIQSEVDVGMADDGSFVVVWTDMGSGYEYRHIYAQRYYPQGWPLGSNFQIEDGTFLPKGSEDPSIGVAPGVSFVIAWYARGIHSILAQRFQADGQPLGTNMLVQEDFGNSTPRDPSVGMDKSRYFTVSWTKYPLPFFPPNAENSEIYAQCFNPHGNADHMAFKVNDDSSGMMKYYQSLDMAPDGSFVTTWVDNRWGKRDVYAQRFDASGTSIGPNFKVNEDKGTPQDWPTLAVSGEGNAVIAWEDQRRTTYCDVFAQRLDGTGQLLGGNFKVNDDSTADYHFWPSAGMAADGSFVIVWMDERESIVSFDNLHIFGQRYDPQGNPLGPNFRISEEETPNFHFYPDVGVAPDGSFVVVWEDLNTDFLYNIYARRYDADGNTLGRRFMVNDLNLRFAHKYSSVEMAEDSSFVIAWMDRPYHDDHIYAQRYDSDGRALGSNIQVDIESPSSIKYSLSLDVFPDGAFVITWEDYREDSRNIFAQSYDSEGFPVGSNFRVNDDTLNGGKYAPTVAVSSDGSFVIAWTDYRNGICNADVYAQKFDAGGIPVGDNFRLNNEAGETYQGRPAIGMDDQKNIYVCWLDNRIPDHSNDIYAKIISWEETSIGPTEISNSPPSDFKLCQNYPNPFNPDTDIRYQISDSRSSIHSTLKIYNILGQEVRALVDECQEPGYYMVTWNGQDGQGREVPSGVYFYRLQAGEFMSTKRMILSK